jgi:hypothetical protein
MRKIILILLIVLMGLSQFGIAQTVFKYGPELGVTFSRFPKKWTEGQEGITFDKVSLNPMISPLIGINGQLTLVKYLQFTMGLQYQMAGDRFYSHREGSNLGIAYTTDTWIKQTFHKICLPLTVGFTFRIGKVFPSIYGGYRPNLFIAGKKYSKSTRNDELPDEYESNLFTPGPEVTPFKRYAGQWVAGFSLGIGQNINIALNANFGTDMMYGVGCFCSVYKNSDYALSLTYLFTSCAKKTSTADKK